MVLTIYMITTETKVTTVMKRTRTTTLTIMIMTTKTTTVTMTTAAAKPSVTGRRRGRQRTGRHPDCGGVLEGRQERRDPSLTLTHLVHRTALHS